MSTITLETISYPDATMGRLYCKGLWLFTLELPWRDNERNVSCFPAGVYKYKKRFSPSKQTIVIQLIDVPNRTYIQIHAGNFTSQIEGCILVGDSITDFNHDTVPDVTNSEAQMIKLLDKAPTTGTIEVIRHGVKQL